MSEFRYLQVEQEGELAVITLSKPPMNALNTEFLNELAACIDFLSEIKARVVIFTGAGKAFVAGADIAEMKDMSPGQALEFSGFGQSVFDKIEKSGIISIAAVNGYALGGGLELALACDIRIASERAKFSQPETSLGIIPGFGGTCRLARTIPKSYAKLMILSGRVIDADEAHRLGLVDVIESEAKLLETAKETGRAILSKSPNATRLAIQSVEGSCLESERQLFSDCFKSPEQKEGMEAFLEKRAARFNTTKETNSCI